MKILLLYLSTFGDAARNISDAEYQKFYTGVVDVSEIYGFDRFQFKSPVSLLKFLNFRIYFIIY